jgi:hypothetical protein
MTSLETLKVLLQEKAAIVARHESVTAEDIMTNALDKLNPFGQARYAGFAESRSE